MSDSQAGFEALLSNLLSDSAERATAEKTYLNTKKQHPNEVVQALLQVGRTSNKDELRSLAIILLRRALTSIEAENTLWQKLNPDMQQLLKQQLLFGVEKEPIHKVRSDFIQCVICVAADSFESNETWEGFIPWVLNLIQGNDTNKVSALEIISDLSSYLIPLLSPPHNFPLQPILQMGFSSTSLETKVSTLKVLTKFVPELKEEYRSSLQAFLTNALDCLATCLNQEEEEHAMACIRYFISLCEYDAGFYRPSVSLITNAMLKIAIADGLEDETKRLALEFLVTLAENKPKMCLSVEGLAKNMIYTILQWMLDIPDISPAKWNLRAENDDDEVDIENSVIAEEALDRICMTLTGEVVVPIIFAQIPSMATHQDWKQRYVALMSLSMIGEGCHDFLHPHLENIVNILLPLFYDPHPRVRWAAANTAGQMATDFGPTLQKNYHSKFLPSFIHLLDDVQNPKVQSHISAALVNFCEKFDGATLHPYLQELLTKLMVLIQKGNKNVQETALTAVASVAGCAGKYFNDYYDMYVPFLKEILTQATADNQRLLRGKAFECFSLIGVAVGKDKFRNDVQPFIELLNIVTTEKRSTDDPMKDLVSQSWIRVASCLGVDFAPYLPLIMPSLLAAAALDCSFQMTESSIVTPQEEEDEDGWDFVELGESTLKIHTAGLEDKAEACTLLLTFASEVKEGFAPYVGPVCDIVIPLLKYNYHDAVRNAALSLVPHLLNAFKLYTKTNPQSAGELNILFCRLFPALVESVHDETDLEVIITGVEAIHESLTVMESGCLTLEQVRQLLHEVYLFIVLSRTKRECLADCNPDKDDDISTTLKEELLIQDELLRELAEVIGSLVKWHTDYFLQAFHLELLGTVGDLIQRNRCAGERQLALCIFDDLVEHAKEKSFPLWDSFMPFMLEYATDPNPEVRQASCYGLGVCAQQGGLHFQPYTRKVLDLLLSVISHPNSRVDANAPPTENAISSLGKLIHFREAELAGEIPELIKVWLNSLPLEVDDVEARAVHKHLCLFIINNHPHIFGPDFVHLPKILAVFARILKDEEPPLIEDKEGAKNIIKQMRQQMPGELLAKAFAVLSPAEQAVLHAV